LRPIRASERYSFVCNAFVGEGAKMPHHPQLAIAAAEGPTDPFANTAG